MRGEGIKCTICDIKLHTSCKFDIDPECNGQSEKQKGFLGLTFKSKSILYLCINNFILIGKKKSHQRGPSNVSLNIAMASKVSIDNLSGSPVTQDYRSRPSNDINFAPAIPARTSTMSGGNTFNPVKNEQNLYKMPVRANTVINDKSSTKPPAQIPSRTFKPGHNANNSSLIDMFDQASVSHNTLKPFTKKSMRVIADYSGNGKEYLTIKVGDIVNLIPGKFIHDISTI